MTISGQKIADPVVSSLQVFENKISEQLGSQSYIKKPDEIITKIHQLVADVYNDAIREKPLFKFENISERQLKMLNMYVLGTGNDNRIKDILKKAIGEKIEQPVQEALKPQQPIIEKIAEKLPEVKKEPSRPKVKLEAKKGQSSPEVKRVSRPEVKRGQSSLEVKTEPSRPEVKTEIKSEVKVKPEQPTPKLEIVKETFQQEKTVPEKIAEPQSKQPVIAEKVKKQSEVKSEATVEGTHTTPPQTMTINLLRGTTKEEPGGTIEWTESHEIKIDPQEQLSAPNSPPRPSLTKKAFQTLEEASRRTQKEIDKKAKLKSERMQQLEQKIQNKEKEREEIKGQHLTLQKSQDESAEIQGKMYQLFQDLKRIEQGIKHLKNELESVKFDKEDVEGNLEKNIRERQKKRRSKQQQGEKKTRMMMIRQLVNYKQLK